MDILTSQIYDAKYFSGCDSQVKLEQLFLTDWLRNSYMYLLRQFAILHNAGHCIIFILFLFGV